jgi:nitric oxide reductase NorE protein
MPQNELSLNTTPTATKTNELPSDLAMCFFILMELTVFALFFVGFAVTQNV